MCWPFQGGDIDSGNKFLVKLLDTSLSVWSVMKWLLMLGCIGMLGLGGFLFTVYKKQTKVELLEKQQITKEMMAEQQ
jgi:hypothetical protein